MVNNIFPRQDIPEKDKNNAWRSSHLSYAEAVLANYNPVRQRMSRLYNVYNGIKDPTSLQWITHKYGKENKAPFIPWRVGKTKIDLLNGEWLKRPLVSTVTTINSDAVAEKMRQRDFMKGAMLSRDEIETVKNVAGVDIMNGIEIPKDESVFESMNFKNRYEDVMQIIINKQTARLDVKQKMSNNFLDCEITNYCYGKIELDDKGKVQYPSQRTNQVLSDRNPTEIESWVRFYNKME